MISKDTKKFLDTNTGAALFLVIWIAALIGGMALVEMLS